MTEPLEIVTEAHARAGLLRGLWNCAIGGLFLATAAVLLAVAVMGLW